MSDKRSNLIRLPSGSGFNRTQLTHWQKIEGNYILFFTDAMDLSLIGADAAAFGNWIKDAAIEAQMTHQRAMMFREAA